MREGEGKRGEKGRRVAGVVERRDDVPILVALTAKVAFVIGKAGSVGRGETHSLSNVIVWHKLAVS